jgi:drug/metabolite transporter (DMT)-like permease
MNVYVLALASAACYGAGDFMGGLASRRTGTVAVVLWSQLAGLVVIALGFAILPSAHPAARDLAWGAVAGVAGALGVGLLYHALSITRMSVVAPITGVCALSIPVVAGLIAGERPGAAALVGVALAAVAVVLISREAPSSEPSMDLRRGVIAALAAGLVVGIFLVALARVSSQAGLWPLVAARGSSVSLSLLFGLVARRNLRVGREALGLVLVGGMVDMAANVFYMLAVQRGLLTIVATLSSLYPGATVLLAAIVLRERLRPVQMAGLACAGAAIVLITV